MLISCPECKFEREINPDSVPATAVMATCPHCRHRFKFREVFEESQDLKGGQAELRQTPAGQAGGNSEGQLPEQEAFDPNSPNYTQEQGDDPLPPGAMISSVEASELGQIAPKSANNNGKTQGVYEDREASASRSQEDPMLSKTYAEESERYAPTVIPWEAPEQFGYLHGLYYTVLQVMFGAPKFFGSLARAQGKLLLPVIFYLILGVFQALMSQLWAMFILNKLVAESTDPKVQQLAEMLAEGSGIMLGLLLTPLIVGFKLMLFVGAIFLMFRLVQPEKANLAVILRVVAYSSAVTVVSIIPFVGAMAGSVWFAVCCFTGCKYALNLPWSRVALALGPLYLIALAFGVRGFQDLVAMVS